jgi:hypothetical protein
MRKLLLLAPILATLALPVLAGDDPREERVQFKAGAEGATVKGHLKGREYVDYLLGAQAGQRMTATLHTDNASAYFNVLPAGSEEALFVGSSSGNRFDGTLPASGDYRIRVYLMRAAARRGEQAHYSLDLHIARSEGAEGAAHAPDFADGLAGGPDFWEVRGVPAGDTLNLRAGPAPDERVLGELANGSVLRNLGCRMAGGQRWCQVARPDDSGPKGWVVGRYLRESSYQP